MELKHGIHLFEGTTGVNCYWMTIDEGVAIIDTANPKNENKFLSQLGKAGKQPEDVKFIVITHADIDHAGSAAALRKITGAKIAIHEADAAIVKGEMPFKKGSGFAGILYRIMMYFARFTPVEADIPLKEGDHIAGFKVLHMPGHTAGSIMLYRPDQVLLTGDTLLSNRKGRPRGPMNAFTPDMDQAWRSIQKLEDLNYEIMLPGHGKPILDHADDKVRDLIVKHRN